MTNILIAIAFNLVGMLVIYSLMADALTRYCWHGRGTMSVFGTIIVAGLLWMVPPYVLFYELKSAPYALWLGNWLVSSFSAVILCQSVRSIPRQLEDSARLDGFGWFGTYWHVVLPLVRRELGLIGLLTLMATSMPFWGAFTSPGMRVVPPWFYLILPIGTDGGPGGIRMLLMILAGSVIMTLPVMLIFFLSRKWFPRPAKLGSE